jgi:hypothetical protein
LHTGTQPLVLSACQVAATAALSKGLPALPQKSFGKQQQQQQQQQQQMQMQQKHQQEALNNFQAPSVLTAIHRSLSNSSSSSRQLLLQHTLQHQPYCLLR